MFSSGCAAGYTTGAAYTNWTKFPTTMRTEPSIVLFTPNLVSGGGTAGTWSFYASGSWQNPTVIGLQSNTADGFGLYASGWSGTSAMYTGAWTASAEL